MTEETRALFYPLGFLAALLFSARFLVQWLTSERQGRSVVPRAFWRLSLVGNALLFTHAAIQLQLHVACVQAINGVIAWRNLNLMKPVSQRAQLRTCLILLAAALAVTIGIFWTQHYLFHTDTWTRIPKGFGSFAGAAAIGLWWHAAGMIGIGLFSSRFWVQWWQAEREHQSVLSSTFWWMSLIGALLSTLYFARIGDTANLIGPAWGMIPYLRNLLLTRRQRCVNIAPEEA